ncbi:MAG: MBL fold metallo-hydrolase RNA specificity domain-containing protein, partial [Saprospiraceae bacterium]
YDKDLAEYILTDSDPFGFNSLKYVKDLKTSKSLNHSKESCIIISASGMMNAGRAKHHLFNSVADSKNGVLIVGYCSPYTPGGALRAGAKKLTLFGQRVPVNAKVYQMDSFSAHGDRKEMLDFVVNQKNHVKKIFLVHGTLDRQKEFRTYLNENGFQNVEIPELGQEFQL